MLECQEFRGSYAPIGEQQNIIEQGKDLWRRLQQTDHRRQSHGVGHDSQPLRHRERRRGVKPCTHTAPTIGEVQPRCASSVLKVQTANNTTAGVCICSITADTGHSMPAVVYRGFMEPTRQSLSSLLCRLVGHHT